MASFRSPARAYLIAVAASAIGFFLTWAIAESLTTYATTLMILAVMVSAWYGGMGPAILATVLLVLGTIFFIIAPFAPLYLITSPDLVRLSLFVFAALVVSVLTNAMRIERGRAEQLTGELSMLQSITASFGGALTVEQIAETVVTRVLKSIDAAGGSLLVVDADDKHVRMVRCFGYDEEVKARWLGVPIAVDDPRPGTAPIRTGETVEIESLDDFRVRYPEVAPSHESYGFEALTVVPCRFGDRVLGAIAASFRGKRLLTHGEMDLMATLAQQCGQALERVRLIEAEHGARAEAERANRAKGAFLALTSHELRTPLNAIIGYLQLLEMEVDGPLTKAQRAQVERCAQSAQRLLEHISAILAFARAEAGQMDWRITDVGVAKLFSGLEPMIMPQMTASRIAFACELADESLTVRADHTKVEQILLNLASNALKFTAAEGRISLSASARGDEVVFRVRDTGIGIDPVNLSHIFEPFVQAHEEMRPTTQRGAGLGLAISRDFARGMAGELTAESTPGVGSMFTLTLPRVLQIKAPSTSGGGREKAVSA